MMMEMNVVLLYKRCSMYCCDDHFAANEACMYRKDIWGHVEYSSALPHSSLAELLIARVEGRLTDTRNTYWIQRNPDVVSK